MAKKPEQTSAVVEKKEEAVPAWIKQDSNRGSEEVGARDLVLPRLEIVQSESPIKDTNDDAEEGMLFNTVTGDLLPEEVRFVPIYFRVEWIVWKSKKTSEGGFFGAYDTEADALARKEEVLSEGGVKAEDIEVVDTPVHYGLRLREDGRFEQIVVSMPKSKAKVSRKWNAIIQLVGGDRFSRVYKITTFKDKNKQGKTFWNYVVQPAGFTPEAAYFEAERLYRVFRTQGVKTDHASAARTAGEGGEGGMDTDPI